MGKIYIGYPAQQYESSPATLVASYQSHPEWHNGWQLSTRKYELDLSLNANNFCSMVLQLPGPVVLLERIQTRSFEEIRRRLSCRVPVILCEITTIEELLTQISTAIANFERGEPLLPLDIVAALLMMRKFDLEHMWTGNSKGYMWVSDIPKGRGLDLKFEPRVANVLNILCMNKLVVFKVSNSKKKYALNPDKREEIYDILRTRKFPLNIEAPLLRHHGHEGVRTLDILDNYNVPTR